MRVFPRTIALSALLFSLAASVVAQNDNGSSGVNGSRFLDAKHRLSIGAAEQRMSAGIRATVDGFDPVGVKLDDLGVDDRDWSYYVEYLYRWKPRWTVIGGAYKFNGTGSRIAQRDFNYNGIEFTADSEVRAELDIDAYLLDVMYESYRSDRAELLLGGGIHALDLGATLSGRLAIGDSQAQTASSGTTLLAPVPNLRASGTWAFSERFAMTFVAGWLSANIEDYSGAFTYMHLRGLYAFTDRFGVALGLQRTDIDITQERSNSDVNFDVRLTGPTLSLTYEF